MQQPDTKPGSYYVTAISGARYVKLLGPFFDDHAGALAMVDPVRVKACEVDPRAHFFAFGTARLVSDKPGSMNALMDFNPGH